MTKRQLFLQHIAQTSPSPLAIEIAEAKGMYLYDPVGKSYLDLIAGIGVSALGHCHPNVVTAAKNQLDKFLHTLVYGEYVLAPQVDLATMLTRHLPKTLNSVYFVNSGTEATEGAMKLAKRFTGRSEIISCRKAYHGSTQGAASLMSPTDFTRAYYPLLPDIKHIDFNCLTCLHQITHRTAAVFIETIQGEWGVRCPTPLFMQQLRQKCTETGTLLVLDEIQAGYGRTGSLFAFEQYDIVPDILLLAKGMGGGMPIGAFVASQPMMQALSENPILGHITTFGGHPVSCAAALATLRTLTESNLIQEVKEKEALFHKLLVHPEIHEVRSAGLLMAVQMRDFAFIQKVISHCLSNGLITDWFLFNSSALRIAPPLIITKSQIEWACNVILEGITKAVEELGPKVRSDFGHSVNN